MIFSNDGHTQVGGDPIENIIELTFVIRTMRIRYEDIDEEQFLEKMLVIAGRLSLMEEDDVKDVICFMSEQEDIDLNEVIRYLDEKY